MRVQFVPAAGLLVLSVFALAPVASARQALPVRNGRPVVASVSGSPISLDAFVREAGPAADRARLAQGRATADEMALLDRLITIKLAVGEASTMGLDEAPEIGKQVEVSAREIMREILLERLLKSSRPDPAAVEKQYRELVREWKTASLLFKDEAAAKQARKELAAGAAFKDVSAIAVGTKTAQADADSAYHARKDYLPEVADALAKLQPGQVAPVVKISAGFVVVKLLDVRYPQNPEARAQATKLVRDQQDQKVVEAHDAALRRQYAVVNQAVLKSIDYAAPKPGVDGFLKDKRVVVEIKGGSAVTVADLTEYLRMQFFHGNDDGAEGKRMNAKKEDALNATLSRRLLNLEAQRAGIDKTEAYRERVGAFRDSLVFNAFVQKVIVPGNKMREDEVQGYYNGHLKDYSYPEMMKVRGIAFARRDAAEATLRKVKEGTDFGWLRSNATGQVGGGAPGLLTFTGQPVTTSSMPEGLRKALVGVKSKEARFYASPENHFYVLMVDEVIPTAAKPYGDVRDEIAKKLYAEKLNKSLADYAAKLRAKTKVETYLKRVQ